MTLTEEWKKGELEDGLYWVMLDVSGDGKIMQTTLSFSNGEPVGWRKKSIKEVLAPVPSYEKWKTLLNCVNKYEVEYIECANDYENIKKENQQLKELLNYIRDEIADMPATALQLGFGWISEAAYRIDNAIGEKK